MELRELLREISPLKRPEHEASDSAIAGIKQDASYFTSDEFKAAADLMEAGGDWRRSLSEIPPSLAAIELDDLSLLPFHLLERIRSGMSQLRKSIRPLETWLEAPETQRRNPALPPKSVDDITTAAVTLTDDLSIAAALQIAVRLREVDAHKLDNFVRSTMKYAESAKEYAEKIEGMAKASQETTRRLGVEANASHFSRQAQEHRSGSQRWLWATALTGLSAAIWAAYTYVHSLDLIMTGQFSSAQLLQITIAKVVVFSFLVAISVWCARIYQTHRHNYVVNKHRQNALSTFETFVSATEDPQVKHAILTQATGSIFLPQNTGYGATSSESTPTPHVVETIRNVVVPSSE